MDELRATITSIIRRVRPASERADAILAIPEIAEALHMREGVQRNLSQKLGPSISTNRRDPV